MAVVSDNRLQYGRVYDPDVINSNDYYAFGGQMNGRDFAIRGAQAYRYGFNGKENDNEVKGAGNQQDYGMRIYDPRIAKFLSVDPITAQYPDLTPYQFASNSPIENIDLDGLEKISVKLIMDQGKPVLTKISEGPKTRSFLDMVVSAEFKRNIPLEYNLQYKGQTYNFSDAKQSNGLVPMYSLAEMKYFIKNPNQDNYVSQDEASQAFKKQVVFNSIVYNLRELTQATTLNFMAFKSTKPWGGPVDYSGLNEPRRVGPGLETTPSQRQRILEYNKKMNGGVLRSDEDGSIINMPTNVPKGGKADMKQAEVDHIDERVTGGSNSNRNLRVVSKEQNLKKESQRRKQ
jgi:RHS repeat-associated protein